MKIGIQSQSGVVPDLPRLLDKKPISVKLLGNALNLGIAQTIRERSPQTFIVLRTGGNWAVDDDTFIPRYCDEAARLADPFLAQGLCDLLEPPNEPVVQTVEPAKVLNDRQVQYAQTMKARGYRVGAYNFSVGNPDYSLWPYLQDGIRASDGWLLLHEYGARGMQDNAPSLALRHRNVYPLLAPDIQANLKIGITESGIDLGNVGLAGGYGKYYPTNDQQESIDGFLPDLSWYDGELAKDPYVKWVNLFGYAMVEPWVGLRFDVAEIDTERAKYIQWQQAGVIDLGSTPPVDPPPTGDTMTTAEKRSADGFNAAGVAYNKDAALFKYAQANKLGYPITNEYNAVYDGQTWINQGYREAIVGCVVGDYQNVKAFDWLTGAPYVPPTVPPVPPPDNPQTCPDVIAANGAVCELITPPRKYVLAGASVKQGVSAFCVVTVIGKNGVPVVGAKVVNLFKDSTNGELVQTDGSGAARFQFGASSASSIAGQGPFTFAVSLDGWKDTDSQPPVLHAGTIISDLVHSVSDWQGQHTEWAIQFVQVQ